MKQNHVGAGYPWAQAVSIIALVMLCWGAPAGAQPVGPRGQFPVGSPRHAEELPASRLRQQLDRLPQAQRDRAVQWLQSFHFAEQDLDSLHSDLSGGILYACPSLAPQPAFASAAPEIQAAAVPISPFPASLLFHSRPGAANVLFLDFDGDTVTNTQWNTEVNRSVIAAQPFSTDSDFTTYSDSEQSAIKRIWQRVAEDYAPFNIDVTTERPATFNNRTAVALIPRKTDANGDLNPFSTAGGVAYVNVFGSVSFPKYRPAWVYQETWRIANPISPKQPRTRSATTWA